MPCKEFSQNPKKKNDEQFANNRKIEQYVFKIENMNKNGYNTCTNRK